VETARRLQLGLWKQAVGCNWVSGNSQETVLVSVQWTWSSLWRTAQNIRGEDILSSEEGVKNHIPKRE
jgi:hypothetical protein